MATSLEQPAKLALENGSVFAGFSCGAIGESLGEIVFNTSMTGYQEILTDPSYAGQIVTMTYPEIGNYGVNSQDCESDQLRVAGFIVRECSRVTSNFRGQETLDNYLKRQNVVGLKGIDTRALVRLLRDQGAMKGIVSSIDLDDASLVAKAQNSPSLIGRDLVKEVIPEQLRQWDEPLSDWTRLESETPRHASTPLHVVAMDFGMKHNIARHLHDLGCKVTVVPGTASADEVLALNPDGVFLSNGPGDPEPVTYAIEAISKLLGQVPLFGICLGHQLLCLACGARTFKLKFGHRGANQPVQNLVNGRVEITAQNHGFAVDQERLPQCLEVTHRHLNDDTIAGVRHREFAAFSVQYHPEASAGPHDSHYLFAAFLEQMEAGCGAT